MITDGESITAKNKAPPKIKSPACIYVRLWRLSRNSSYLHLSIRYLKKQTQRDIRLQKSLLHGPSSGNTASFYFICHSSENIKDIKNLDALSRSGRPLVSFFIVVDDQCYFGVKSTVARFCLFF
ncbi:hypothetical protein ACTXLW_03795 [Psychrobacter celer]|uniref:hypothetical protein n=1 Tax=Psychrobacter celer TaxID=306572 RepID=UPI003FD4AAD3